MKTATLPRPLRGIIPPMVTPLADRDELDLPGLERLVEHLITGGVHGLFLLGSTGEGPSLTHRLQRELVEKTVELAAGRVPILVGVTDPSLAEAIDFADFAADAGAQAVVAAPPPYFPPSPAELVAFMERLAAEQPLPLLLYNMPGMVKVRFELDTVRRLMEVEKIIGLKDSSADMMFFHRAGKLIAQRPDWSLLIGPEELLAESVLFGGGHGGIAGGANIFPRLYVALYEAAARGDAARAAALQRLVHQVSDSLYTVGTFPASVFRGIKAALGLLGICGDRPAEPFLPYTAAEREILARRIEAFADLAAEGAPAGAVSS